MTPYELQTGKTKAKKKFYSLLSVLKPVLGKRFNTVEAIADKFIQNFGKNFFKMKKSGPLNLAKELGFLRNEATEFQ